MSTSPLVSIITPSFNQAAYIEATLRSVLDQDYPNIEYLVIDGGSTDGSLAILERYTDQLAYFVSEPDSGQAEAINKGLRQAKGEFVAWLNSDDIYLPGALAAAVAALQAQPQAGLVYGDLRSIDAEGNVFNTIRYQDYTAADLLAMRIIGQPSVFMRRAALDSVGLLDESYQFLLDHHLWLRIARDWPIQYSRQTWAAARHHAQAKNTAQAAEFGREAYRILDWAQIDPALQTLIAEDPGRVWGGAHRLNARYLMEGGDYDGAFLAYHWAFGADAGYALKHGHRFAYVCWKVLIQRLGLARA
jgi:glycosyltransferase involved in cell wall biosynthesis